jgi:hypothetical protein
MMRPRARAGGTLRAELVEALCSCLAADIGVRVVVLRANLFGSSTRLDRPACANPPALPTTTAKLVRHGSGTADRHARPGRSDRRTKS